MARSRAGWQFHNTPAPFEIAPLTRKSVRRAAAIAFSTTFGARHHRPDIRLRHALAPAPDQNTLPLVAAAGRDST